MKQHQTTDTDQALITGLAFVSAYVDDFDKAYDFYTNLLGLEKKYNMGDQACFFGIGDEHGLYLQGGHEVRQTDVSTVRSTFTLTVASTSEFFAKLKDAGVTIIDTAPVKVGEGHYWFQFYDPAGNVLEAFGAE
ncbi:MAG: VOC family protein [Chlorobi bacterium]|nr:VOC family protein [Chlorobiota bacterium]